MTLAINYETESEIVESDADACLHLPAGAAHRKFMHIHEPDGTIHLVPLDQLHESERAILESRQLYDDTRTGLSEFAAGESTSADWLFEDECARMKSGSTRR
ncbi:MAG: hypothetical protein QG671_1540 [Actinomycetota bacterium]|nr:hypothetical protein [Actinomycetota bacterium]